MVLLQNGDRGNTNGAKLSIVLCVEFLEFRKDVFAVCVLAERGNVRTYLLQHHLALRRIRHVDHLLHDVVGKLVLHHRIQRTLRSAP